MVASLDPHSAYLDKKAYRELREGTEGKFVGLGIEIAQSDEGYIKIVAPIEDSPAWRAGIKAGDLITRIDGLAIQGLGIDEAIKKMRGEPRTKVTLTVAAQGRAGAAQLHDRARGNRPEKRQGARSSNRATAGCACRSSRSRRWTTWPPASSPCTSRSRT